MGTMQAARSGGVRSGGGARLSDWRWHVLWRLWMTAAVFFAAMLPLYEAHGRPFRLLDVACAVVVPSLTDGAGGDALAALARAPQAAVCDRLALQSLPDADDPAAARDPWLLRAPADVHRTAVDAIAALSPYFLVAGVAALPLTGAVMQAALLYFLAAVLVGAGRWLPLSALAVGCVPLMLLTVIDGLVSAVFAAARARRYSPGR